MATLIVNASPVTASPPSRAQRIRSFLQRHNLRAWIARRPDELVMLSGYFPFWGASKRGAGAHASRTTCWSPNQGTRSFPELKAMQKGQTIGVEAYDQH